MLLVALAVALPFTFVFVSAVGEGVFSRYSSLINGGSSSAGYKEDEIKAIPKLVAADPFGFGLGTAGPAAAFGGRNTELYEGHNVNAETTYNFIFKEVGLPGLIVWPAMIITMLSLAFAEYGARRSRAAGLPGRGVRARVRDVLHVLRGARVAERGAGPLLLVRVGVAAYWLAGPGWQAARRRIVIRSGTAALAAAP